MNTISLESTIRDLVDRGASRQPELRARLEKAAFLLLFRPVSPQLDGTWTVGSECDQTASYRVNLNSSGAFCTCQDSLRHPGQECKHSLAAVMLSRALLGLERHTLFDEVRTTPAPIARLNGRLPRVERED